MKKGKKITLTPAHVLANLSLVSSKVAANTRCVFIYHQPKMPECVSKLRKE